MSALEDAQAEYRTRRVPLVGRATKNDLQNEVVAARAYIVQLEQKRNELESRISVRPNRLTW